MSSLSGQETIALILRLLPPAYIVLTIARATFERRSQRGYTPIPVHDPQDLHTGGSVSAGARHDLKDSGRNSTVDWLALLPALARVLCDALEGIVDLRAGQYKPWTVVGWVGEVIGWSTKAKYLIVAYQVALFILLFDLAQSAIKPPRFASALIWFYVLSIAGDIFTYIHFRHTEFLSQDVAQWKLCLSASLVVTDLYQRYRQDSYALYAVPEGHREQWRETNASLLSRAFFLWVNPLISAGSSRPLEEADLWELDDGDKSDSIVANYKMVKKQRPQSSLLSNALFVARDQLFIQLICAFFSAILKFTGPFFLNRIIDWVTNPERDITVGWFLLFAMFAAGFAEALTNGQLYFAGRRSSLRIRSILVEEIYQKAMRRSAVIKPSIAGPTNQLSSSSSTSDASTKLSEPDEGAASLGKIVTLMSVDAERLREFVSYAHRLVLETPISVGLALSGLFFVLGWSAVVGVLMLLLGTVLGACAGSKIGKVQEQVMTNTDKRVNITNEVLQGIRIIKYLAWESQFMKRILEARKTELAALKRLWLAYIGFNFTATLSSLLVAFATFACYTTVAGHTLDSQTAFTAIALLQQISVLIAYLPWQITEVFQAKVSLERINKFLREPELEKYSDTAAAGDKREFLPVIGFRNASFTYYVEELVAGDVPTLATDTGHAPAVVPATAFVLRDIDQEFPIGGLSVVCGPTGAGKSSLLLSLLGEMKRLSGFHNFPDTRNLRDVVTAEPSTGVAFASQTPWLLNATIRDNILFGNPYDAERYQRVVKACALLRDLETLDGGDLTEIGEKGVNMSGGQKARISLARAAYSPASTVLLDDPLSAVDAATAKHLLHDCILGLMRNRTRILVSHAVGLVLPHADLVIGIQNGQVIATGEAEEVARSMDLNGLPGVRFGDNEPNEGVPHGEAEVSQAAAALPGTGTKLVEAEERAVGRVPLSIYWSYFAACGGAVFIIVYLAILLLVNAAQLADDWWIKQWSDAYMTGSDLVGKLISRRSTVVEFFPELLGQTLWDGTFLANDAKLPVGGTTMTNIRSLVWLNAKWAFSLGSNSTLAHNIWYYIGIYGALGASVLLANLLRVGYILLRSTTAARNLHATLLKRVLGAPLRFFEVTPLGRILNRFSKDVQSIDTTMVQSIDMFAVQVTKGITIIGLIAYVGPSFVLGALPIVFIYWYVANQYLQASRELKRLESLSRSPIYSQFSETLTGVTTIRAYGAEERFLRQAREKVDGNHRAYFLLWAANRWLTVRTDLLGAFVALATGIVVVEGNLDPGWAGLALTYALSFSDALLWIVRQHAEVEMNMNSVERINDYISIEQEAPAIIQGHRPPSSWPGEGRIEVTDLCVKYSDDQPVVLKNISFSVRAREKIGVVGRTGAGKSTLSLAFFRILPITGGTIIIDGIDIMTIGLQDLRSQINIIPQDPVLFSGTLRSNMDPFDEYDDAEIWSALRSAHVVESLNHGRSGSDMTITGELGGRLVVDNHIGSNNGATSLAPPDPSFTLDYPVAENGSNFSQGQRQLLCLARALLRRTRVVFLDEATASVDNETDAKIQATIRECFVDATVLCVAHRLRTVMDYDRILVLDHGNVVEFGTPLQLLEQREALGDHFRRMVAETGEFEDLLEVARQAGKKRARQEH